MNDFTKQTPEPPAFDFKGVEQVIGKAQVLPMVFRDVAYFLAEPDEPEQPIIDGLIDAGDRCGMVAQSKERKSFFALQLAIAICLGISFLGFTVHPKKVLLVNGEILERHYKKRVRRMLTALGVPSANLGGRLVLSNSANDAPEAVSLDFVLQEAIERGSEVVIVDPFYIFVGNESDQDEVKRVVRQIKSFSRHGITLLMVFHSSKGMIGDRQLIDRISGSSVFARDVSTLLSLVRHEDDEHTVLDCICRNHPSPPKKTILFNGECFEASDLPAVEKTSRSRTQRVFDFYDVANSVKDGMNYGEAVKAIMSAQHVGRDKSKDLLGECTKKGLLRAEPSGVQTIYHPVTGSD